MNDDKERAISQEQSSDLQPCCDGGSCCPSGSDGGGKNWKIGICILVVLAAGAVLARSIIRKSDTSAEQGQDTFAAIQPVSKSPLNATAKAETPAGAKGSIDSPSAVNSTTETEVSGKSDTPSPLSSESTNQDLTAPTGNAETPVVAKEKTGQDTPVKASPTLWRPELDSIASLGKVAADTDAVFIFLAADDQETTQTASKQIEAAAKMIQSNGVHIAAFRLNQGAPNYANLKEQLSVPCVLAMVKGGGLSGVPADQITETKLIQAFVAASRPSGCGSGGCGPAGCN